LDSDHFEDYRGDVVVGREYAIQRDDGKLWRVVEIEPTEPRETIVFEPVE
jgi:hypothetical protein